MKRLRRVYLAALISWVAVLLLAWVRVVVFEGLFISLATLAFALVLTLAWVLILFPEHRLDRGGTGLPRAAVRKPTETTIDVALAPDDAIVEVAEALTAIGIKDVWLEGRRLGGRTGVSLLARDQIVRVDVWPNGPGAAHVECLVVPRHRHQGINFAARRRIHRKLAAGMLSHQGGGEAGTPLARAETSSHEPPPSP
jgi:hypothetical protein